MMRAILPPVLLLALALGAAACDHNPLDPGTSIPPLRLNHSPDEVHGGAFVQNSGEGQPDIMNCFFGGFTTTQGTVVRSPSGQALLSCQFEGLPPIPERIEQTGWFCTLAGSRRTSDSHWVRLPNGQARLTCHFGDKPPYNAVLVVNGEAHFAHEPQWTTPLGDMPGGSVEGAAVFVGFGCAPISPASVTGSIAVFERGICPFATKLANAVAAGAVGAVVFNDPVGGDVIIQMAGTPTPIPAVFVGRSTGLAVLAAPAHLVMGSCRSSLSCRGEL